MTTEKPAQKRIVVAEAARKLGVSRHHLYCVLNGQRQSARLLAKIQKLFPSLLTQN
jgi:hypothetical protein